MPDENKTRREAEKAIDKPKQYRKFLERMFNMKDALGRKFPYRMLPYQYEWHKKFYLVDPEALNRIWTKGRGEGATAITMMDLIVMAMTYDDLTIPVTSMTGKQAKKGPITWGLWHCDNPQIEGAFPRNMQTKSEIELLTTGSTIMLIAGSNPESLRTYRAPAWYADEFDWCQSPTQLLDAGEMCLSEGGQISIVSTIQNENGPFYKIVNDPTPHGYWKHEVPIFDPKKLDPFKSLHDQVKQGLIKPIAPWIKVDVLERLRYRDVQKFLREAQCVAPDTSVNFMPLKLVVQICSINDFTGDNTEKYGYYTHPESQEKVRYDHRPEGNYNPFVLGWDFARYKDLSVAEIFEHTEFGIIQRAELVLRGSDTPLQNSTLDALEEAFNFREIRIDMTGNGTGFYDYAYKTHGGKVSGIHFNSSMESEEDPDMRVNVKHTFAIKFRNLCQDGLIKCFNYREIKEDFNLIPYDLSNIKKNKEGSHGDRFFGCILAAYPPSYNRPFILMR